MPRYRVLGAVGCSLAALIAVHAATDFFVRIVAADDPKESAIAKDGRKKTGTATAAKSSQPASAKFLLRYKFHANQAVHYEVTSSATITITKGTFTRISRNESRTLKHFVVLSVADNGTAILEPILDSVKMSSRFGDNQPRVYDSRLKTKPLPRYAHVARTIGKPLVRLKVKSDGTLLAAIPLISRKVQSAVVVNRGAATKSNDANKNFLVVFPGQPLSVGETWSDTQLTMKLKHANSLKGAYQTYRILRKYTLQSVENNVATIRLESASLKSINDPGMQAQMIQRLPSGTIQFDVARGLIVGRTLKVNNTVIGFQGAQSRLHVKSLRVEQIRQKKQ